jgi:hypothetical protein
MQTNTKNILIISMITIAVASTFLFTGPIPQDPDYHNFADTRKIWGIRNAFDVLSNAPFVVVSGQGG